MTGELREFIIEPKFTFEDTSIEGAARQLVSAIRENKLYLPITNVIDVETGDIEAIDFDDLDQPMETAPETAPAPVADLEQYIAETAKRAALGDFLSNLDGSENYDEITAQILDGNYEGAVWQPFENTDGDELFDLIDNARDNYERLMRGVAERAGVQVKPEPLPETM